MSERTRKRLGCPQCGQALHRSHRRLHERAISLVVPLRRYSCHQCGWSGVRVVHRWSRVRAPRQKDLVRAVIIAAGLLLIVIIVIVFTPRF